MHFSDLANELVLHVFQSCVSITDVLNLASTCHHFHAILNSSHRLPILYQAAEAQLGPLDDAIRLVTHNQSQAVHLPRQPPPQSFPLLQRLLEVGHTANQWTALYPSQKWRGEDSASRRSLSSLEQHCLRRACYRIWLYTSAFHTPLYPRTSRLSPQTIRSRAALLRPWPSHQLAEILDLHTIFRQLLHSHICPSNGTVIRRHKHRYPDDPFPLVSITAPGTYRRQHMLFHQTNFHCTPHMSNLLPSKYRSNQHGTSIEGWGDEIAHYYVVEDMLKLGPGQLMYLFETITISHGSAAAYNAGCSSKGLVESYVAGLGDWFENNGETISETVGFVVGERGRDVCDLKNAIEEGREGIARRTEEAVE